MLRLAGDNAKLLSAVDFFRVFCLASFLLRRKKVFENEILIILAMFFLNCNITVELQGR